jgi:hypothetical protein
LCPERSFQQFERLVSLSFGFQEFGEAPIGSDQMLVRTLMLGALDRQLEQLLRARRFTEVVE